MIVGALQRFRVACTVTRDRAVAPRGAAAAERAREAPAAVSGGSPPLTVL